MGETGCINGVSTRQSNGPDRPPAGVARRADESAVKTALADLRAPRRPRDGMFMPASIAAAKAGWTTGELRVQCGAVHGGITADRPDVSKIRVQQEPKALTDIRASVDAVSDRLGRRLKFLVGKPRLDGHSNGAETDRVPWRAIADGQFPT